MYIKKNHIINNILIYYFTADAKCSHCYMKYVKTHTNKGSLPKLQAVLQPAFNMTISCSKATQSIKLKRQNPRTQLCMVCE